MNNKFTDETVALIDEARPLFAGKPPMVQGAALASLLATWIAGHRILGHPDLTKQLRDALIQGHVAMVWDMIEMEREA